VRAVLRRAEPDSEDETVALGDVLVDRGGRAVTVDGAPVELTGKEFDLLAYLFDHAGLVLSRERLLDRVWGLTFPGGTRTVDVHVAQLRKKLGRPEVIRTIRGAGYKAVAR
jgi:DNA-binding response OmpR family regulator